MTTNVEVLYVQSGTDLETTIQTFLTSISPTATPTISLWSEGSQYIVVIVYLTT